jgi:hypothetical protein
VGFVDHGPASAQIVWGMLPALCFDGNVAKLAGAMLALVQRRSNKK